MELDRRFVIGKGTGFEFALSAAFPWPNSLPRPKTAGFRLGVRCINPIAPGLKQEFKQLQQSLGQRRTRLVKGNEVNISAKETATDYQEYLILEIWLESKTRERIDLQEALEIIAATRNQIGWE